MPNSNEPMTKISSEDKKTCDLFAIALILSPVQVTTFNHHQGHSRLFLLEARSLQLVARLQWSYIFFSFPNLGSFLYQTNNL